jgi:hypothetical protein
VVSKVIVCGVGYSMCRSRIVDYLPEVTCFVAIKTNVVEMAIIDF